MSEVKRQQKNYALAAAMTIAVFCMGQIPGSIDAAISKITEYFHLTATSGLYVTTVASLVCVAFSILLGMVAGKKIGFRPLILFCAVVELFSAITPFFTTNFVVLLILRGLFGIGFGGMQSLENTVATQLISPQKRASVIGFGTFFGFGMNCVLQLIGGILADRGWNYVFLNHLLLIIPFVIVVIGCLKLDFGEQKETKDSAEKTGSDGANDNAAGKTNAGVKTNADVADAAGKSVGTIAGGNDETETELHTAVAVGTGTEESFGADNRTNVSERMPSTVWAVCVLMFVVGVMIAPLLIGCSFLSAPIDDSATVAGIVAVCFSVGCMVGGILYSKIIARVGKTGVFVFLLVITAGLIGCGLARSIAGLCVLIFVAGLGFSSTQATMMFILGKISPGSKIAFASAIMMALFNFGMFASSSYESAVGAVTGDALYMPLYIGAVVMAVLAVIYGKMLAQYLK